MKAAADSPYRVIVMGKTGSGKSSVLNSLTRTEHFHVGDSIMSETREVQTFRGKFKGRLTSPDIVFIDTPGFFDSSSRDNKVIAKIAMSLHTVEDGLNLVLFCFPAYEIRLDSSMQASWRFLKLVMGKAVYEHVVIVLTHGNRLAPQELENAVRRMTTEFIPYLHNNLKCKVKDEILIYKKGEENDGLEEVLKYITSSAKYLPKVMEDLGRFWKPDDPLGSIEYLLQNSQIFNKIQELLFEVQDKNEDMQDQLEQIKREMASMGVEQDKQVKSGLQVIEHSVSARIIEEKKDVDVFKDEVGKQVRLIQRQLEEKDKQIHLLKKDLEEVKSQSVSGHSSLAQPPLTTRAKEQRIAWERERPATTERRQELEADLDMSEELRHGKQPAAKEPAAAVSRPAPHAHANHPYPTKAQCMPMAQYHSSHTNPPKAPAQAAPARQVQPQRAAPRKAEVLRPANPQSASNKQLPPGKAAGKVQMMGAVRRNDHAYGVVSSGTPKTYFVRPGLEYMMPK